MICPIRRVEYVWLDTSADACYDSLGGCTSYILRHYTLVTMIEELYTITSITVPHPKPEN